MILSVFASLCSHHHFLILGHFYMSYPWYPLINFHLCGFACVECLTWEEPHNMRPFLTAFFHSDNVLEVCLCYSMNQCIIFKTRWTVFQCVWVPCFVYQVTGSWIVSSLLWRIMPLYTCIGFCVDTESFSLLLGMYLVVNYMHLLLTGLFGSTWSLYLFIYLVACSGRSFFLITLQGSIL